MGHVHVQHPCLYMAKVTMSHLQAEREKVKDFMFTNWWPSNVISALPRKKRLLYAKEAYQRITSNQWNIMCWSFWPVVLVWAVGCEAFSVIRVDVDDLALWYNMFVVGGSCTNQSSSLFAFGREIVYHLCWILCYMFCSFFLNNVILHVLLFYLSMRSTVRLLFVSCRVSLRQT